MFESLTDFSNDNKRNLDELQQGSLFHTIEYEISGILMKIKDIDNLDDSEIQNIIARQYKMILNYDLFLVSEETRSAALYLFTNKCFLKNFLEVVRLLDLGKHEKVCLNKIAYDYYISPNHDELVADMLYRLTTEVNGKEVTVLSGIMGIQSARILSMIRNSSFKEEKCIHRVNTFLIKSNHDLNVSQIISIYCYLFERFTHVFVYTMFETRPDNLTPEQYKKFDNMSIALLSILDSLTTSDIRKVLLDYGFMYSMVKHCTVVRFSLKTAISYKRIIDIIKEIEMSTDLVIP